MTTTDNQEDEARIAILNAIARKAAEPALTTTHIRELAEAYRAVKVSALPPDDPNAVGEWIDAMKKRVAGGK